MDYEFLDALETYTGVELIPGPTNADYAVGIAALESIVTTEYDSSTHEAALEGNVISGTKELKTLISEARKHKKAMKAALKSKDFETAANEADAVAEAAKQCTKAIDSLPNNVASNVLVNIAVLLILGFIGNIAGKVEAGMKSVGYDDYYEEYEDYEWPDDYEE